MRVARIVTAAGPRYAVARDSHWAVVEDPFVDEILYTGERAPFVGTELLAPVDPKVVVGIAHNKTNNDHHLPIQAWYKSPRMIANPDAAVPVRSDIGQINLEGELVVVIGKPAYRLTLDNALDAVFGYTIGNDFTNVDQAKVDEKFFHVKGGRSYAPIGPWIETDIPNPDDEPITVTVNGVVLTEETTASLPSTIAECLVYVTQWIELGPGDVILTGAPRTFFPTRPGDRVDITLPSIGTLSSTIIPEEAHV